MGRKLNEESLDHLKEFEGWREKAYRCPGGHWTIGYGHKIVPGDGINENSCISKADGLRLLEQDVETAAKCVENKVNVHLTDNEFGALVSFVYNLGSGTFGQSSIPGSLNAGNKNEACNTMQKYVYASKVKLPGLVKRRAKEVELFQKAVNIPESKQ